MFANLRENLIRSLSRGPRELRLLYLRPIKIHHNPSVRWNREVLLSQRFSSLNRDFVLPKDRDNHGAALLLEHVHAIFVRAEGDAV